MTEVKVVADQDSREKFGLTESMNENAAYRKAREINESGQGDAQVVEGQLQVRQLLRD